MADVKVTEVKALETLIAAANGNSLPYEDITIEMASDKGNKMIAVRSKKRERKTDNSKTLANIALGEEFAAIWGDKGDFKASDVKSVLDVSPAKASAICRAMKWATVPTTEKVNVYTLN